MKVTFPKTRCAQCQEEKPTKGNVWHILRDDSGRIPDRSVCYECFNTALEGTTYQDALQKLYRSAR